MDSVVSMRAAEHLAARVAPLVLHSPWRSLTPRICCCLNLRSVLATSAACLAISSMLVSVHSFFEFAQSCSVLRHFSSEA